MAGFSRWLESSRDNPWRTSTIREPNWRSSHSARWWVLKRSLRLGVFEARLTTKRCYSGCNKYVHSCTAIKCWSSTMVGRVMPAKCQSTLQSSDPDSVFTAVLSVDKSSRKTVGSNQATIAATKVQGFPQRQAMLWADLQQIVESSSKAIVVTAHF